MTKVRLAIYAFKWCILREKKKCTSDDEGTSRAINAVIQACHIQALLGFLCIPPGHKLPPYLCWTFPRQWWYIIIFIFMCHIGSNEIFLFLGYRLYFIIIFHYTVLPASSLLNVPLFFVFYLGQKS